MIRTTIVTALLLSTASTCFAYGDCGDSEHYRSSDHSCVHRPYHTHEHVQGELAVCRDGTHSVSHHRRGTCSHHGGVGHWD